MGINLWKVEKKLVYAFWKKGVYFKNWKEVLQSDFNIRIFYNINQFLEALFFNPPQIILYQAQKDPEGLEMLIRDIKIPFNLVQIPIILIIDFLENPLLKKYLSYIDDFLLEEANPKELLLRINFSLERIQRISDNNPLTGLPGNVSIERLLKMLLESPKAYMVGYLDLDNFKAYNDLYGFSQGDELIKNLARILKITIEGLTKEGFVGHIGGDDFLFIVPLEIGERVAQEIIDKFDSLVPKLVSPEDYARGYFISKDRQGNITTFPLPSVSIAMVPVEKGKFKHIGEIAERAGEIKKLIKKQKGNIYFIDRRR